MTTRTNQCGVEVMFNKGIGYTVNDVYTSTFYCMRDKEHDGPHIIAVPDLKDLLDEEAYDE